MLQDYIVQEMMLAAMYAPQNLYCYVVDEKASSQLKSAMNLLAACLPNVFIVPSHLIITGDGANMTRAHLACMRLLLEKPNWEYVILLQVGLIHRYDY